MGLEVGAVRIVVHVALKLPMPCRFLAFDFVMPNFQIVEC